MCTAMTMETAYGDVFFGRTMDFSYPLKPEFYYVPKGFVWNNLLGTHQMRTAYSFMGVGQNIDPIVFADGVNESGFSAAALYFPGYASYVPIPPAEMQQPAIAAIEVVRFLLGFCQTVAEADTLLRSVSVVGVKDSVTNSVAPLHWIMADRSGASMAVEKTENGLHIMNNPIGVLSNSPDFNWHMTNLRNYGNLAKTQIREAQWGSVTLSPFGQGAGTFGLPGDYTPASRFVRTAFQKTHVLPPADKEEAVNACFHIMEGVSIPKGIVITERGTCDYTQYTAFISLTTQEYYYKTYENSAIRSVRFPINPGNASQIISLGKLSEPTSLHPQPVG